MGNRKRRIVQYNRLQEQKKIEEQKAAEQKAKADAIQRAKVMQNKRKIEKVKMDHLRERMEQMKITKKYEIPEGFTPEPPASSPEADGDQTAMGVNPRPHGFKARTAPKSKS